MSEKILIQNQIPKFKSILKIGNIKINLIRN